MIGAAFVDGGGLVVGGALVVVGGGGGRLVVGALVVVGGGGGLVAGGAFVVTTALAVGFCVTKGIDFGVGRVSTCFGGKYSKVVFFGVGGGADFVVRG